MLKSIRSILIHRDLCLLISRKEIKTRFRGTLLGGVWAWGQPLVMLATYTFVFSVIFKARWPATATAGNTNNSLLYALQVFCGLIIFSFASEVLTQAPSLIIRNPNYVKKIIFPLEVLPESVAIGALVNATIGTMALMVVSALINLRFSATWLWAPLLLVITFFFVLSMAWLISAMSVYLRDLTQIVSPMLNILMFLTPIFYPISAIPDKLKVLVLLNPLASIISQFRLVLIDNHNPALLSISLLLATSLILLECSFRFFKKASNGFADLI